MSSEDKYQKLLDRMYRFLGRRNRSEKEIADYLARKKASNTETLKIVEILKGQNLINDSEFAQWWLEQRAAFRPKGKKALRIELKQKGITDELINRELDKVDELQLAKKALLKKKNLVDPQKITNFLLYRGFNWETIKKALAKKGTMG